MRSMGRLESPALCCDSEVSFVKLTWVMITNQKLATNFNSWDICWYFFNLLHFAKKKVPGEPIWASQEAKNQALPGALSPGPPQGRRAVAALPLDPTRQGRSQTFQNEGAARGAEGWAGGADRDSKWRLSINLCTKCNFIWGGKRGGRVSARGGGCPPLPPLWLRHCH